MTDPFCPSLPNITTTACPPATINITISNPNGTVEDLEALGRPIQAFLITLYSSTALLALIGNLTVIVVEIYGKKSAPNLRKFLINLAVSDILIGVLSVPFSYTHLMLGRWIFPLLLCPLAQFVQLLSVLVTSFTLTVISIER